MRDGARIQTAIEILNAIKTSKTPMDNTIRDYLHHKRYIGSKDRKSIVELVYNVVRATARLGWWMDKVELRDSPRTRVIAYLMLSGLSQHDVKIRFVDEKYCPGELDDPEIKAIEALEGKSLTHDDMPVAVRCECPEDLEGKLTTLFGDEFEAQLNAMLEPAGLDLRVNTIKLDVENAQNSLQKDDVETVRTTYSPVGLRCIGKPYMSATKAFHKGFVEIQDEGSQLISHLCGVEPGMRVMDYCAGGGGKTLALAAKMQGKGIIFACDNDSRRLEKGRRRYKKADVHNIEVRSMEEEKNRKWLRRQKGAMDVVLVDAPCSSSGTWRRNPDLRWHHYGPSLDEIKQSQAEILERVADKIKVGGRLVYATCSLFIEENEAQIEAFLSNHPEYKIVPIADVWPKGTPCPAQGNYLRLTPKDHKTDGFFTAVLTRQF